MLEPLQQERVRGSPPSSLPHRPGEGGPLPHSGGSDRHPGATSGAWPSLRVSAGDCAPLWGLGRAFPRLILTWASVRPGDRRKLEEV